MEPRKNLGWAVSGSGTILRAVLEGCAQGLLQSAVRIVICDRPSTIEPFLLSSGILCHRLEPSRFPGPDAYQRAIKECLIGNRVDWMGLTFNRLLSPLVIDALDGRIFNIHMSRLPDFKGFHPIRQALASGGEYAGATVHAVDAGMDTGPILAQVTVAIDRADTESTLGRRLFETLLPCVLQTLRAIEREQVVLDADRFPRWPAMPLRNGTGLTVSDVDADLAEFSRAFCRRL